MWSITIYKKTWPADKRKGRSCRSCVVKNCIIWNKDYSFMNDTCVLIKCVSWNKQDETFPITAPVYWIIPLLFFYYHFRNIPRCKLWYIINFAYFNYLIKAFLTDSSLPNFYGKYNVLICILTGTNNNGCLCFMAIWFKVSNSALKKSHLELHDIFIPIRLCR